MKEEKKKYNIAVDGSLRTLFHNGTFLTMEEVIAMGYDSKDMGILSEIAFPFMDDGDEKKSEGKALIFISKKKFLWAKEKKERR